MLSFFSDFAVATDNKILFYDSFWNETTSVEQEFHKLGVIVYNKFEDALHFNDNGIIYLLKLSDNETSQDTRIIPNTNGSMGIAFDIVDQMLYWTDFHSSRIYQLSINKSSVGVLPKIWRQLNNNTEQPLSISIDSCRRKLYWISKIDGHIYYGGTIEQANLDGTNHKVLISKDSSQIREFVVDQFTQSIYWVETPPGSSFSIYKADLSGSNVETFFYCPYGPCESYTPTSITVDSENIYWADGYKVWRGRKNCSTLTNQAMTFNAEKCFAEKVLHWQGNPYKKPNAVVSRNNFPPAQCSEIDELTTPPTSITSTTTQQQICDDFCENQQDTVTYDLMCRQ